MPVDFSLQDHNEDIMVSSVRDLAPNPKNPRKITDHKLVQLKRALEEFGDLGGFVYNRKTKTLVSGHQRAKIFEDAEVVIEKKFKKATKTGTVAEGHVLLNGERFQYREVSWDDAKAKAATLAANNSAGEWDRDELKAWMTDLGDFGFDLELTMFSEAEIEKLKPIYNDGATEEKKKQKKTRSASDDIKGVNLLYTDERLTEFNSHIEFFQNQWNHISVSDVILSTLREYRGTFDLVLEEETEPLKTKLRKNKA